MRKIGGRREGKGEGRECRHLRTGGVVLFLSQMNTEIRIRSVCSISENPKVRHAISGKHRPDIKDNRKEASSKKNAKIEKCHRLMCSTNNVLTPSEPVHHKHKLPSSINLGLQDHGN